MKRSNREKLMLIVLVVLVISFGLYKLLLKPLYDETTKNLKNVQELRHSDVNVEDKSKSLNLKKAQLVEKKRSFDEMSMSVDQDVVIDDSDVLIYLGDKIKELSLNMSYVERLDDYDIGDYSFSRYELTVDGSYKDIILFVDSLYNEYEYLYVDRFELRENELISIDSDGGNVVELPYDWASDAVERVSKYLDDSRVALSDDVIELRNKNVSNTELYIVFRFLNKR